MNKTFTLLSAALLSVGAYAEVGDVITDISQIQGGKCYNLVAVRGVMEANGSDKTKGICLRPYDEANPLPYTKGSFAEGGADTTALRRFYFIKGNSDSDAFYIYNAATKSFLTYDDSKGDAEYTWMTNLEAAPAEIHIQQVSYQDGYYTFFFHAADSVLESTSSHQVPDMDEETGNQKVDDAGLPLFVNNYGTHHLNVPNPSPLGGDYYQGKFDGWNNPDDGNAFRMVECEPGDDDVLPDLSKEVEVSYHLIYKGVEVATATGKGMKGEAVSLPAAFNNPWLKFSQPKDDEVDGEVMEVIPEDWWRPGIDVYFEAEWAGLFDISPSYAEATWYNLDIRRNKANPKTDPTKWRYVHYKEATESFESIEADEMALSLPEYQWAVIGEYEYPFNKLQLVNRGAGEGKYLKGENRETTKEDGTTTTTYPIFFTEEPFVWNAQPVDNDSDLPAGIAMWYVAENGNNVLNQLTGWSNQFGIWNGGNIADDGSVMRFTKAVIDDRELTDITLNASYNGAALRTATVKAYVGQKLGEVALPAELSNGLVDFAYDKETVVAANGTYAINVTVSDSLFTDVDGNAIDQDKWYNIDIRDKWWVNAVPFGPDVEHTFYTPTAKTTETVGFDDEGNEIKTEEFDYDIIGTDEYKWQIKFENPYQVYLINASDKAKTLGYDAEAVRSTTQEFDEELGMYVDKPTYVNAAVLQDGKYLWNIYKSGDGICLESTDETKANRFINQDGGDKAECPLGFWNVKYDSGSKLKFYLEDSLVNGIKDVNVEKAAPVKQNAIYNLNGQRVKTAVRGINIINGRKVVIR